MTPAVKPSAYTEFYKDSSAKAWNDGSMNVNAYNYLLTEAMSRGIPLDQALDIHLEIAKKYLDKQSKKKPAVNSSPATEISGDDKEKQYCNMVDDLCGSFSGRIAVGRYVAMVELGKKYFPTDRVLKIWSEAASKVRLFDTSSV